MPHGWRRATPQDVAARRVLLRRGDGAPTRREAGARPGDSAATPDTPRLCRRELGGKRDLNPRPEPWARSCSTPELFALDARDSQGPRRRSTRASRRRPAGASRQAQEARGISHRPLRFPHYAANPPAIDIPGGWDVTRASGGCGSPFVTSTDGNNNMIVWVVGTEDHQTGGDQRLHGYDGDTGAVVYGGGGPNELMAGTHYYSTTGIAARGRIYVAGDNKVYAFALPRVRLHLPDSHTHYHADANSDTDCVTPTPTATPTARPTPTPRPRPNPPPRPTPPR